MGSITLDDDLLGREAKILDSGVSRVVGRVGVIVEIAHARRPPTGPVQERLTVDVPGHGEVVLRPNQVELLPA
jgi:hypothetical protein